MCTCDEEYSKSLEDKVEELQRQLNDARNKLRRIEVKGEWYPATFDAPESFNYQKKSAWCNGYTCGIRECSTIASGDLGPDFRVMCEMAQIEVEKILRGHTDFTNLLEWHEKYEEAIKHDGTE